MYSTLLISKYMKEKNSKIQKINENKSQNVT